MTIEVTWDRSDASRPIVQYGIDPDDPYKGASASSSDVLFHAAGRIPRAGVLRDVLDTSPFMADEALFACRADGAWFAFGYGFESAEVPVCVESPRLPVVSLTRIESLAAKPGVAALFQQRNIILEIVLVHSRASLSATKWISAALGTARCLTEFRCVCTYEAES